MAVILIADDDVWFRRLLVQMLKKEGHDTVEAVDGADALARMRAQRPDAVIMDMLMPNMDGADAIVGMRQQGLGIPIIAMSGGRRSVTSEFNLESARLLGAQACLPKPFTVAQLRTALAEVLR
jgi:CheY-like chemotaxis protein